MEEWLMEQIVLAVPHFSMELWSTNAIIVAILKDFPLLLLDFAIIVQTKEES